MRLLFASTCKGVLPRPDGVDLLGVNYAIISNKFPKSFDEHKLVTGWELDAHEHETYVMIREEKGEIRTTSDKFKIPAQNGLVTTQFVVVSLPNFIVEKPQVFSVEVYLDEELVFSFPFFFLNRPNASEEKFNRIR